VTRRDVEDVAGGELLLLPVVAYRPEQLAAIADAVRAPEPTHTVLRSLAAAFGARGG
jgi:hypothetical protein